MIRTSLLALALSAALGAQAGTVTYNFSGTVDQGDLLGAKVAGQLSFDDAALDANTDYLSLLSLFISFGGTNYLLANADAGTTNAAFGAGQFLGANAVFTTGADQLTLTDGFGSPYLAFVQGGLQGSATLTFSAAAVPEPQSYALMLTGLGIVGFLARRRKTA